MPVALTRKFAEQESRATNALTTCLYGPMSMSRPKSCRASERSAASKLKTPRTRSRTQLSNTRTHLTHHTPSPLCVSLPTPCNDQRHIDSRPVAAVCRNMCGSPPQPALQVSWAVTDARGLATSARLLCASEKCTHALSWHTLETMHGACRPPCPP